MSLNNNKLEINIIIDNNNILFILEPKEIKLDKITIQKNREKLNYIDAFIKNKGIIIVISIIIVLLSIFLVFRLRGNNDSSLIDNNVEKNKGVVELISTDKNGQIKIKKHLLNYVKHFISCLGIAGKVKVHSVVIIIKNYIMLEMIISKDQINLYLLQKEYG